MNWNNIEIVKKNTHYLSKRRSLSLSLSLSLSFCGVPDAVGWLRSLITEQDYE